MSAGTSYAVEANRPRLGASDFLRRLSEAAALHAGVTPVTRFTLGYILSGHLDEEITRSQRMNAAAAGTGVCFRLRSYKVDCFNTAQRFCLPNLMNRSPIEASALAP